MEGEEKRQKSKAERIQFLRVAEQNGISDACERMGVSRSSYYYWKGKLEEGGEEALGGRSGGKNKGEMLCLTIIE